MNLPWLPCLLLGLVGGSWEGDPQSGPAGQGSAPAKRAVEMWVQRLKDKDPEVRRMAAEALGNVGAAAGPASASLVEALQDSSGPVRAEAAWALRQCTPLSKPAINALVRALKDVDPRVRMWAAKALGKLQPEIDYFADYGRPNGYLADRLRGLLFFVAILWSNGSLLDALGEPDLESAKAIRSLSETLTDHDARVRRNSAQSLGEIGSPARLAVPFLVTSLNEEDEEVRAAARAALSRMGPHGRAALEALREPRVIARLVPTDDDPVGHNRPLRSAALRMPFAYVMDREGRLYVFKVALEQAEKALLPLKVLPDAGDGNDLKIFKDLLLCTRHGRLEGYSLKDPGSPRHIGRFGPEKGNYQGQSMIRKDQHAYLIGKQGIHVYDLSDPAEPSYLGLTPCDGHPWTACVSGKYLYAGTIGTEPAGRTGIAVFDIADPRAISEVGFVAMDHPPFHLFAIGGNRLLASQAGSRISWGGGVNGSAQLFSLANPRKPTAVARVAHAGGKAAALLSSEKHQYFVCAGGACLIDEKGLGYLIPHPSAGALMDARPYQGDNDARYAILALGDYAVLVGIRTQR